MGLSGHSSFGRPKCLNGWAPDFCIKAGIHSGRFWSIIARPRFSICPEEIIWPFAQESCCIQSSGRLIHVPYSIIGTWPNKHIISCFLAKPILSWIEELDLLSLAHRIEGSGFFLHWVLARTTSRISIMLLDQMSLLFFRIIYTRSTNLDLLTQNTKVSRASIFLILVFLFLYVFDLLILDILLIQLVFTWSRIFFINCLTSLLFQGPKSNSLGVWSSLLLVWVVVPGTKWLSKKLKLLVVAFLLVSIW